MNKEKNLNRKLFHGITGVSLLLFLFLGKASPLYSSQNKSRVSISLSFGYFLPKEQVFKDLYGNHKPQWNLNVRFVLKKNVSLYSGLRYLSCKGETQIVGPEFQEEKYELKFFMYSIPLALIYSTAYKNVHPFFGGGASFNIYKEEWEEFGITSEDEKLGFFLIGGAEYFIGKRFSFLARAQYSLIPTKQGGKLDENINLGGIEFSIGISFHL